MLLSLSVWLNKEFDTILMDTTVFPHFDQLFTYGLRSARNELDNLVLYHFHPALFVFELILGSY